MSAPQNPEQVLAAVRRLEADLESMRARARRRESDLSQLRADLADDAARERRLVVEDLEHVVELVGASWRTTHEELAALRADVASLRAVTEAALTALRDARLEVHFSPPDSH